jgi:hypothetical protein
MQDRTRPTKERQYKSGSLTMKSLDSRRETSYTITTAVDEDCGQSGGRADVNAKLFDRGHATRKPARPAGIQKGSVIDAGPSLKDVNGERPTQWPLPLARLWGLLEVAWPAVRPPFHRG